MDWRIKVELFEQIRREYEFGVGTIKGVARKFGVHHSSAGGGKCSTSEEEESCPQAPEVGSGGGVCGRYFGEGSRDAPQATTHGAPDSRADSRGVARLPGFRVHGAALCSAQEGRARFARERNFRSAILCPWG